MWGTLVSRMPMNSLEKIIATISTAVLFLLLLRLADSFLTEFVEVAFSLVALAFIVLIPLLILRSLWRFITG